LNRPLAAFLGFAAVLAASSCAGPGPSDAPAAIPAVSRAPTGLSAEELGRRGEEAGIHNLAEVAPGLLRGAQPEGDGAFALLAGLGVKTILTVDGSRPEVENAARQGIRYVHIPVEYAGFTRDEQVRIAKVAVDLPGPLFVHCHHGKHRGPAACGIAWMARDGAAPEAVVADMRKAGTDPRYAGLYGDVVAFRPVTREELARVSEADLPPVARTPDLVGTMVRIDSTFDRMKAIRQAGWQTPPSMPDLQPSHEARILAEHFRELARLDEAMRKPADFQGWRREAEKSSWELEEALGSREPSAAAAAMDRVGASCAACHDVYRNTRPDQVKAGPDRR